MREQDLNIYKIDLENNKDLHLLVTDQCNKILPRYGWYNYKHSFSRDLVFGLLNDFGFNKQNCKEHVIFDPFCGAGTTLLASKEYGIKSIGMDIMPFSVFISTAKTYNYDFNVLLKTWSSFSSPHVLNMNLIDFKDKKAILQRYYDEKILDIVLKLYAWIDLQQTQVRLFFLTALFSILEDISNVKKDGGFLRFCEKTVTSDMVLESFENCVIQQLEDIQQERILQLSPEVTLIQGDARAIDIPNDSISAIITSPPYPNRHDYTRIYYAELALGFYNNNEDIKRLRYDTLRSHVEARKKKSSEGYSTPSGLNSLIADIKNKPMPNKSVIPMLEGYFEDMHIVFIELKRILKQDGYFALVVCDVRYSGVIIPVVSLLQELAANVGFKFVKKIVARHKHNSAQQMKEYGKKPIEESIIIWQK
jgi:DNA modification methylase